MLRVGIEHEFVFADEAGRYLDADNSRYSTFSEIVDNFPTFAGDDAVFDCKSLEHYPKRCYVEGFERHDREGRSLETLPKGLEIRTLPHASADGVIAEFRRSYAEAMRLAGRAGLSPVLTSRHPFKTSLAFDARLGDEERKVRSADQLALARSAMFTHGINVNVSLAGRPVEQMLGLVEKVNYYAPVLIPWSFSSPFYEGKAFDGLCCRNYFRAHSRRMADLHRRRGVHVLEFRGFDACGDAQLLAAVLNLFCGFLLDDSLPGKAPQQDPERLKLSSLRGFDDPSLRQEGQSVLRAARAALDGGGESFDLLDAMLRENDSYAARMKSRYAETGCIMDCISGQYSY
jgi:hypothetical protein